MLKGCLESDKSGSLDGIGILGIVPAVERIQPTMAKESGVADSKCDRNGHTDIYVLKSFKFAPESRFVAFRQSRLMPDHVPMAPIQFTSYGVISHPSSSRLHCNTMTP